MKQTRTPQTPKPYKPKTYIEPNEKALRPLKKKIKIKKRDFDEV